MTDISTQLDNLKKQIEKNPTAHTNYHQDAQKVEALRKEKENIELTQTRLRVLHKQRVTEAEVYGSYADQPEWVQENLLRWKAHPENIAQEQLAMIPPVAEDHDAAISAITGGHAVGTPFHLDIDSIV
ncbi:MAG: hypothetical protein ACRER3_11015 [Pseudomonas fluorescens]